MDADVRTQTLDAVDEPKAASLSAFDIAWRRIRRDPGALLALGIILLLVAVALFAPSSRPTTQPGRT